MTLSREAARRGTIRHRVPYEMGGPEAPCAWCGEPTDVSAETPFRPDMGAIPMHLLCSPEVLAAWRRHQAGFLLTDREMTGMVRLANVPARLTP